MIEGMKALTYEVRWKECSVCSSVKLLLRSYGYRSLSLRVVNPQRGICGLVKGALLRRKWTERSCLHIRENKFVGVEAIRQWNYLPRETVESVTPLQETQKPSGMVQFPSMLWGGPPPNPLETPRGWRMECNSSISYHLWFQFGTEVNTQGRMPHDPDLIPRLDFITLWYIFRYCHQTLFLNFWYI